MMVSIDPTNNVVMMSLMEEPNRKVFGEKLVLLVNREGERSFVHVIFGALSVIPDLF